MCSELSSESLLSLVSWLQKSDWAPASLPSFLDQICWEQDLLGWGAERIWWLLADVHVNWVWVTTSVVIIRSCIVAEASTVWLVCCSGAGKQSQADSSALERDNLEKPETLVTAFWICSRNYISPQYMLVHMSLIWLKLMSWFSDGDIVYELLANHHLMLKQSCMSTRVFFLWIVHSSVSSMNLLTAMGEVLRGITRVKQGTKSQQPSVAETETENAFVESQHQCLQGFGFFMIIITILWALRWIWDN